MPNNTGAFDVFLSHSSKDKPAVRQLGRDLLARGIRVWLDEWELVPGRPWQEALEEIIRTTRSAAVLFGPAGMGPWEEPEMRACLSEFVNRRLPVIPVLLPGAPTKPELPLFLTQFTWVDLRGGLTAEGLDRLEWGITGRKPGQAASSLPEPSQSPRAPSAAVKVWQEKLDFLQQQEAVVADPAQKFALQKQIEEAQSRIRQLGG